MATIVISGEDFKALASKTRTGIIKLLRERNYTLSELSQKMQLSSPTIKQHLEILGSAGLIEQIDDGRKWKYYSLTRKGKGILQEQPAMQFVIMLGITTIALIALMLSIIATTQQAVSIQEQAEIAKATAATIQEVGEQAIETTEKKDNSLLVIAIVIVAIIEGYLIARATR